MNYPYDAIPDRVRAMSEAQLVAEERAANEAITQMILDAGIHNPPRDTPQSLAAEIRLLETKLALSVRVRDATVAEQMANERVAGRPVTAETEQIVRDLVDRSFSKDIDRAYSQLRSSRERLSRFSGSL